jgi:glycine dehydrogenase
MARLGFALRLALSSATPKHARTLASVHRASSIFAPHDEFPERHIGPDDQETASMLSKLGYKSMDAFVGDTVPPKIRVTASDISNDTIAVFSESQLHARAKALGAQNKSFKSYIGMGYHSAVVPPVILRNVSFGHITFNLSNSCF